MKKWRMAQDVCTLLYVRCPFGLKHTYVTWSLIGRPEENWDSPSNTLRHFSPFIKLNWILMRTCNSGSCEWILHFQMFPWELLSHLHFTLWTHIWSQTLQTPFLLHCISATHFYKQNHNGIKHTHLYKRQAIFESVHRNTCKTSYTHHNTLNLNIFSYKYVLIIQQRSQIAWKNSSLSEQLRFIQTHRSLRL